MYFEYIEHCAIIKLYRYLTKFTLKWLLSGKYERLRIF